MNRFIDLCYEITKKTSDELWTSPNFFVFRTLGEYGIIMQKKKN